MQATNNVQMLCYVQVYRYTRQMEAVSQHQVALVPLHVKIIYTHFKG